jgi:hypothetical protein
MDDMDKRTAPRTSPILFVHSVHPVHFIHSVHAIHIEQNDGVRFRLLVEMERWSHA